MDVCDQRLADSASRHSFLGGSDARNLGDREAAMQRLWPGKRGEGQSEDLSSKPGPPQPCDGARTKPAASPVRAAHAEFVAALAGYPPGMTLHADAIDLEDRAHHLSGVFTVLSVYVAVILDDTAQNVPGGLDLPDAEGALADLASDLTGTIQYAADGLAGRIA
jgi:hypothetical protein